MSLPALPVTLFERSVGHARRVQAALHVGDANRRAPGNAEVRLELVGHVEVSVDDRELKARRHARSAALEPDLAVVVLRDAPFAAVAAGRLLDDAMRRPARAKRVVGAVHPVVERPGEERFLSLDVREPPVAGVEQLLLVRDAVAVRVGVLPDLLRVRFLRQDRVRARTASRIAGTPGCPRTRCACRTRRRCRCRRAARSG